MATVPKKLIHEPVRILTKSRHGEIAYARKWIDLMRPERAAVFMQSGGGHYGSNLAYVLHNYPSPQAIGQRQATVAATLISWLGSQMGQRYIQKVAQMTHRLRMSTADAYLATWALANTRSVAKYRMLEVIMQSEEEQQRGCYPTLSADDYEVAEMVNMWLGSHLGKNFMTAAQAEIKIVEQELVIREMRQAGSKQSSIIAQQAEESIQKIRQHPTVVMADSALTGESFGLFDVKKPAHQRMAA